MSRTNSRAASAVGEFGKLDEDTGSFHHMADISFTQFVFSLASSAAIHFGDVPEPNGQRLSEPNLEGARQMIDILALLEEKTKGNLTVEERQLLEQLLFELRQRFVQVADGGKRIIEP